jgi:hypothetical protein
MNPKPLLFIVLVSLFSCNGEKKDSGYDSVSHSIISYPAKNDTTKPTITAIDTMHQTVTDSNNEIPSAPVVENNFSSHYKIDDLGIFGIQTMIFIRDSGEQNPADYVVSSLQEWSRKTDGIIILLGKSKTGIWIANGFCQDGSGEVFLYLSLVDSSGKEQKHRLLRADEETGLKSNFIKSLVENKMDTIIKEEIIPITNSNYVVGKNSADVLNVYDATQNVSHYWYFNFTNTMCWQIYEWDYKMKAGKLSN